MDVEQNSRIDKWLWMLRIFKTRSLATEACRKGRVKINDIEAKASKSISLNDIITVRKPPINFTYKVKGFPKGRVGAKLVDEYLENQTSPDEMAKQEPGFLAFQGFRSRGAGRPTKKERRTLDSLRGSE